MAREWAKLSFESEVRGVSEPDDHSAQEIDLGPKWTARVTYREWQFGEKKWNAKGDFPVNSETPSGGVAVAKLADDEYLVTGQNARLTFGAGKDLKDRGMMLDRVEKDVSRMASGSCCARGMATRPLMD